MVDSTFDSTARVNPHSPERCLNLQVGWFKWLCWPLSPNFDSEKFPCAWLNLNVDGSYPMKRCWKTINHHKDPLSLAHRLAWLDARECPQDHAPGDVEKAATWAFRKGLQWLAYDVRICWGYVHNIYIYRPRIYIYIFYLFIYICVCVWLCIYICVCDYVCMYIYICVCVCGGMVDTAWA
jgi:hypothetical protein